MTDFIYSIKGFFYWLFENTLEPLGNFPNWSFIILAFLLLFWWLKLQKDYTAKAKQEGTLK
jgi:hypothetical protein